MEDRHATDTQPSSWGTLNAPVGSMSFGTLSVANMNFLTTGSKGKNTAIHGAFDLDVVDAGH